MEEMKLINANIPSYMLAGMMDFLEHFFFILNYILFPLIMYLHHWRTNITKILFNVYGIYVFLYTDLLYK